MPPFVIIAHRGGLFNAPENTRAAFDTALLSGFQHCETDVQLTADKQCLIFHDDTLDRTTNGTGVVSEVDYAAIKDLDAGSWFAAKFANERVLLLEELLRQYSSQAHIHLELKTKQAELPEAVAGVIQNVLGDADCSQSDAWSVPGLTITSFHVDQLKKSKQLLPRVRHSWLVHEITQATIDEAVAAGFGQICPRADAVTREAVQLAERAGLSVRAWLIKKPEMLRALVDAGVQGGTVDWPERAREVLGCI